MLTAIVHTVYRKSLLPWDGKLTMLEAGSPIKAGALSWMF